MNLDNTLKNNKKPQKNYVDYEIFKGKIRLVTDEGIKIVDRDTAISDAHQQNMNIVQIAYNKSEFPHAVCKMMNYSKFKYEQKKKDKAQKRATKLAVGEEKEVVFSIRIDDNDKKVKISKIKEFLSQKNTHVKITIKLLRREMNLLHLAKDLMNSILLEVQSMSTVDVPISVNRNVVSCIVKTSGQI